MITSTPPILSLSGIRRSQIVIKIPMVLVLRVNLDFILPFPIDYSSLHVNLLMFREEKYKKLSIFGNFTPCFVSIETHRPQIVIEIPMLSVLRVNLVFILPFSINYLYLHVN